MLGKEKHPLKEISKKIDWDPKSVNLLLTAIKKLENDSNEEFTKK
jgi:hypothetical protein